MEDKTPRPNWWQLYLILPMIVFLAWVDTRLTVGETEHKVLEIGAVLFMGWLANRWISANEYRIMRQSAGDRKPPLVVREINPIHYRPTTNLQDYVNLDSPHAMEESGKQDQTQFPWYTKN